MRRGRLLAALLAALITAVALLGCGPGGPPTPGPAACAWHAQRSAAGVSDDLNSVSFPDTTHGWTVGGIDRPVIEATSDGGATWRAQPVAGSDGLDAVSFVDDRRGWAVGVDGLVLSTVDGGAHWARDDPQVPGGVNLSGVAFTDARHGLIVGERGVMRVSTDGGRTWSPHSAGTTEDLSRIGFVGARTGWVVAGDGAVLTTPDGGAIWRRSYSADPAKQEVVASATFLDALHGWEAGSEDDGSANHGVVAQTTDGGRTWHRHVATNHDDIRFVPVAFTDLRHGWVGTYQGDLLYSDNAGLSFGIRPDPASGEQVYAMTFRDATHGWAVGASATIMACTA